MSDGESLGLSDGAYVDGVSDGSGDGDKYGPSVSLCEGAYTDGVDGSSFISVGD